MLGLSDLEPDDSAFRALTDVRREHPITVEAESSIDDALNDMNRLSVHALLAIRQELAGIEQQVVGLAHVQPADVCRAVALKNRAGDESILMMF